VRHFRFVGTCRGCLGKERGTEGVGSVGGGNDYSVVNGVAYASSGKEVDKECFGEDDKRSDADLLTG